MAIVGLGLGCAGPRDGSLAHPPWPYTQIRMAPGLPPELTGRSMFWGRWLSAEPEGGTVLCESSDPRYLFRLSFEEPRRYRVLDLGPDAVVETLAFLDRGRSVLLVGSVGEARSGLSVVARALLRFDLEQDLLVDTIPLTRQDLARGLALDLDERRAYVLSDDGAGHGSVEIVDLYAGRSRLRREVGDIPAGMGRRGLVIERTGRTLFCLSGGGGPRSDFDPVGSTPLLPGILVLDADSLSVETRIPLDERGSPVALAYEPDRDRLVALETDGDRASLVILEAGFREVRERVRLDYPVTDLAIQNGYAFLPGPQGVAIVDLDRGMVAGYAVFSFEHTGEIIVSSDARRALVFVQGGLPTGPPGIAVVDLAAGALVDVLQ